MNFELILAVIGLIVWALACMHFAAESNSDDSVEIQRLTDWLAWFRASDDKHDSALGVMLDAAERLLALAKQGKSPRRNITSARRILYAAFDRV